MPELQVHPAAAIFPVMSDASFAQLKNDIHEHGLETWGVLHEGLILDGRHRYRACQELGIEMEWSEIAEEDYPRGFDPFAFVLSHNLYRRHLTESQRAMIAGRLATLKRGRPEFNPSIEGINQTAESAANACKVGHASVERAKHVLDHGSDDLIAAVDDGKVAVSLADSLCKSTDDKSEQSTLVKEGPKAIRDFVKQAKQKPPAPASPEPADDSDDHYDHPAVEAFKHADYRLNTLRRIVDSLTRSERSVLADWLREDCA